MKDFTSLRNHFENPFLADGLLRFLLQERRLSNKVSISDLGVEENITTYITDTFKSEGIITPQNHIEDKKQFYKLTLLGEEYNKQIEIFRFGKGLPQWSGLTVEQAKNIMNVACEHGTYKIQLSVEGDIIFRENRLPTHTTKTEDHLTLDESLRMGINYVMLELETGITSTNEYVFKKMHPIDLYPEKNKEGEFKGYQIRVLQNLKTEGSLMGPLKFQETYYKKTLFIKELLEGIQPSKRKYILDN